MSLAELYPQVRLVHIGLAVTSGALFALRGVAVLAGQRWPTATAVRAASMAIDSALLAAALLLLAVLQLNPFAVPWLQVKLAALVAYVVLGTLALKRARTPAARRLCYVGALACFGWMFAVARTHHPLGLLSAP